MFGDRWRGWAQAGVFCLGLAVAVLVVALVNRLRGRRLWQLPDRVGFREVLVYSSLPAFYAALAVRADYHRVLVDGSG